jgi:MFS family permease
MNWNELEVIWQRQSLPSCRATDIEEIKHSFEKQRRRMRVVLFVRNLSEGGAGLLIAPIIGYLWWRHGAAAWPLGISIALLLGVSCVFILDQVRVSQRRLGVEAPLLAKVESELHELRYQRRLIQSWTWWYLLPVMAALVIGFTTLGRVIYGHASSELFKQILTTPVTALWILGLAAVIGGAVWKAFDANRRAVCRQIDPRIRQLQALRDHMSAR